MTQKCIMTNSRNIELDNDQVELILKNKNKSYHYNIFDNHNNFKIGRFRIFTNSFLNSSNEKKFQEIYSGKLSWMYAEEKTYNVDFNLHTVFDLEKNYTLDTYNTSTDIYCMSSLISSSSSSISKCGNNCYNVLNYAEGVKVKKTYHGQSYTLNDHFVEEAAIMDPKKKVGEKFKYKNLEGDKNLTEYRNFKFIKKYNDNSKKEFQVYEMEFNLDKNVDEKLIITVDESFSINKFEFGQFTAELNRKLLVNEHLN